LESELFGHEKGAFTNAVEKKIGRFEMADGGTLFLDEISELSLSNQTKLLRVLQEYEFVRVGGNKTITADVRLIASTNMSLKEAINRGTFRKDLFYRINVVPIELPALRNRRDDIPLLLSYYFQKYKKELRSKAKKFDQNAMQSLEEYGWPGNIRELKNVVERTLTLYGDHDSILNEHLPVEIRSGSDKGPLCNSEVIIKHLQEESLEEIISRMERELIEKALRETNGVQMKAARLLKTTRRILRYKMDKLGMTVVLPFLFMCLFS
jgi:transcriptional regulator with GAF, ATPase, and Fis domain